MDCALDIKRNPCFFDLGTMHAIIFLVVFQRWFVFTYVLNETDYWRLNTLLYARFVNAYLDFDRFTHDENNFIELNSKW